MARAFELFVNSMVLYDGVWMYICLCVCLCMCVYLCVCVWVSIMLRMRWVLRLKNNECCRVCEWAYEMSARLRWNGAEHDFGLKRRLTLNGQWVRLRSICSSFCIMALIEGIHEVELAWFGSKTKNVAPQCNKCKSVLERVAAVKFNFVTANVKKVNLDRSGETCHCV